MAYKLLLLILLCCYSLFAQADLATAKARLQQDVRLGKPLVAHVTVALCDNASQGIVPVGNGLCDGDVPKNNLYWGALYGTKTYFTKHNEWTKIEIAQPNDERILERVAFHRTLNFEGSLVSAYVVADAWRGKEIRSAITSYLDNTSGHQQTIALPEHPPINEGAHIYAFVGHNGLMDFPKPEVKLKNNFVSTSSAIILACKSDVYFKGILNTTNTHKLLTTSGLMAPEAYTLEAAITRWFTSGSPAEAHLAASTAYSQYQKANLAWSKNLFVYDQ